VGFGETGFGEMGLNQLNEVNEGSSNPSKMIHLVLLNVVLCLCA